MVPKASLFGWVFVALLGLYVVPGTAFGSAMVGHEGAVILQRVGIATAIVGVLGIFALLIVGVVRALLKPRMTEIHLTVLLTLLTLALVYLSLEPALHLMFSIWPAAA